MCMVCGVCSVLCGACSVLCFVWYGSTLCCVWCMVVLFVVKHGCRVGRVFGRVFGWLVVLQWLLNVVVNVGGRGG